MTRHKVTPFHPTDKIRVILATAFKRYAIQQETNFIPTDIVRNIVRRIANENGLGIPSNRQIGPAIAKMDELDLIYHFQSVPHSDREIEVGITPYYATTWGKVMADKKREDGRKRLEAIASFNKDAEISGTPTINETGRSILKALQERKKELLAGIRVIDILLINMEEAAEYVKNNKL